MSHNQKLIELCVELLVQFKRAERVVLEQNSTSLATDNYALEAYLKEARSQLAQLSGLTTLEIATLEGKVERELDRQRAA